MRIRGVVIQCGSSAKTTLYRASLGVHSEHLEGRAVSSLSIATGSSYARAESGHDELHLNKFPAGTHESIQPH